MAAATRLHDYELISLSIDYSASRLVIMLKDFNGASAGLEICPFLELDLTHNEPWGKGSYIVSSEIVVKDDKKELSLELNSGDSITVKYV